MQHLKLFLPKKSNLVPEDQEVVHIREAAAKQEPGQKGQGEGKLAPNWEDLFRVIKSICKGDYQLEELNRKMVLKGLEYNEP